MKRHARRIRGAALLFAAALGCESRPAALGSRTESSRAPLSSTRPVATDRPPAEPAKAPLDHIEILTGNAKAADRLPMVIAIHGLGDSPARFAAMVSGLDARARVLLPAGPTRYLDGFAWFPFPRNRTDEKLAPGIRASARRVAEFITWAVKARPTQGKPIVTGFSQGGMISFALAVEYPEMISAAYPVGGALPEPMRPLRLERPAPPIVAFHGSDDPLVPLGPTNASVEHLQRLGFPATIRTFAGVGHSIPPEMHAELHAALASRITVLAAEP
jgi:phospholipase/carboxylesterase